MVRRKPAPQQAEIGVIGGSGLYEIEGLTNVRTVRVATTPFGRPSDAYICGTLFGRRIAFLPRHARGHRIMPTDINYRANIYGMKLLGVERIISVSAVGSMREDIRPGDIVVPHQFYDHTKHRRSTFFGNGVVAHVGMADPVCKGLCQVLIEAGEKVGAKVHRGGTYLCMEGPQFSTQAESLTYRQWNVDVIGMTNATEAKLAREAEICYSTIALATDYDCWHHSEEAVTVEAVLEVMRHNIETSKAMIKQAIRMLPAARACSCGEALRNAIMTPEHLIPAKTRKDLLPIIGKHLKARKTIAVKTRRRGEGSRKA